VIIWLQPAHGHWVWLLCGHLLPIHCSEHWLCPSWDLDQGWWLNIGILWQFLSPSSSVCLVKPPFCVLLLFPLQFRRLWPDSFCSLMWSSCVCPYPSNRPECPKFPDGGIGISTVSWSWARPSENSKKSLVFRDFSHGPHGKGSMGEQKKRCSSLCHN
jgi:hypothetical protein